MVALNKMDLEDAGELREELIDAIAATARGLQVHVPPCLKHLLFTLAEGCLKFKLRRTICRSAPE